MLNTDRPFHAYTRDFLVSLFRQRRYLIRSGLSRLKPEVAVQIQEFEQYLAAYKYDTDIKMARFWLSRADRIYQILPGIGSTSYEHCQQIFKAISKRADQILSLPITPEVHYTHSLN